jgi:hypothetical protein
MATVAVVDGVKIMLYANEHPPPHFHAKFAEFHAVIDIDKLAIIRGSLPALEVKCGDPLGDRTAGGAAKRICRSDGAT